MSSKKLFLVRILSVLGALGLVLSLLLGLLTSCDLELLPADESVNDYIYPYLEFKISEDESYYTVAVVEGAKLEQLYIPAFADYQNETVPIKYFDGFNSAEDASDIKTIVFESSNTTATNKATKETKGLVSIKIDKVAEDSVWGYLPPAEKEGKEFVGWFIEGTTTQVFEGDPITNPVIKPRFKDHSLIKQEEKTATCTSSGYKEACWQCQSCGKCFSDSEGKTEIDVVIPSYGHSFTPWSFDTATGKWHRSCTACQKYEEKENNEHDLIHHAAVVATCTENGSIEYWQCSICNKYYSNANAENEITEADTIVPHHAVSAWTYDLDNHWKECPVDGILFKAEHTWGEWTEHTSGSVTHLFAECEICGARKVATKPEYLVYNIGIGEVKLEDIEDTPCGDFLVNGVKVESGDQIEVATSEVTVEFRSYFGANTDYKAYCFVVNNGSMQELESGVKDADGNYKLDLKLTDKNYALSLQLNTGGGSLSFDCYLIFRK